MHCWCTICGEDTLQLHLDELHRVTEGRYVPTYFPHERQDIHELAEASYGISLPICVAGVIDTLDVEDHLKHLACWRAFRPPSRAASQMSTTHCGAAGERRLDQLG